MESQYKMAQRQIKAQVSQNKTESVFSSVISQPEQQSLPKEKIKLEPISIKPIIKDGKLVFEKGLHENLNAPIASEEGFHLKTPNTAQLKKESRQELISREMKIPETVEKKSLERNAEKTTEVANR